MLRIMMASALALTLAWGSFLTAQDEPPKIDRKAEKVDEPKKEKQAKEDELPEPEAVENLPVKIVRVAVPPIPLPGQLICIPPYPPIGWPNMAHAPTGFYRPDPWDHWQAYAPSTTTGMPVPRVALSPQPYYVGNRQPYYFTPVMQGSYSTRP